MGDAIFVNSIWDRMPIEPIMHEVSTVRTAIDRQGYRLKNWSPGYGLEGSMTFISLYKSWLPVVRLILR